MKLLLITLFTFITLNAAPAFQGNRTFIQPDGSVVNYQNKGDEHLHWSETSEGEIIIFEQEKRRFEYAEIENGELKSSGEAYSKVHAKGRKYAPNYSSKRVTHQQLESLYILQRKKHPKR